MKHMQLITVLLMSLSLPSWSQALDLKSGYAFLTPETQAMQDDDFANPGLTAVEDGRKWFNSPGVNSKTCTSCHGEGGTGFDLEKIARYPVYNEEYQKPFTLQEQINFCWEEHLDNVPFVYDCPDLVELETYVRNLAKGQTVSVNIHGPLKPFYEKGKQLYNTRFGQINVSCSHCHDRYAGQHLRGQVLTQGHSNGFPEYRLGSGKMTTLHGRMTECFRSFRAEPFERGSQEFISLEVYLHARGNGLQIETPAVRY